MATITALLVCGVVQADRVAGLAGIPATRSVAAQPVMPAPMLQSGTVTALWADGSQVEIGGARYLLKPGRSLLLRAGLPVGAGALAVGQKVSFSLASATPGEMALGVVHVP
jgi:hypothetical protein